MSLRLITGRAGSGKTHWCQQEIVRELTRELIDGPPVIMLVPEQAALQMERGLLALLETHNTKTLGRCEVTSFRRFANRILAESRGPAPVPLTPLGRQMAVRLLISRHRKDLKEFAKIADRGGFIRHISHGIAELMQEGVSIDQLDEAARHAEETAEPMAARLHDAALLYGAYMDYLGDARVDPEGVLDLARARLAGTTRLHGARILLDGFAGFTRQQARMILDFSACASQVDIAILLDGASSPEDSWLALDESLDSKLDLFARTRSMWHSLRRMLIDRAIMIDSPIHLPGRSLRFDKSDALRTLESSLFKNAPAASIENRVREPGSNPGATRAAEATQAGAIEQNSVRIVQARDRRSEVASAVREIIDLTRRDSDPMRYRDIAIIVRDLGPYHDILSAELAAHGIPFFIDRRRSTHHHPLVQLVRGLLQLADSRGPIDEAMIRILKCGLVGLPDATTDAIENHVIAFNLAFPSQWERPWRIPAPTDRNPSARTEPDADFHAIEAARSRLVNMLEPIWPRASAAGAHPKCGTWLRRLLAVLQSMNVAQTLDACRRSALTNDALDEAAEHERVWLDLVRLLEEMDESLGEELMTARQLREVLESGLSDFSLGLVPPTLDQVLVSSIERSRHPPIRAAFILGFNEGQFPARITEDTIFGDAERRYLASQGANLGRTRDECQLDERTLAYIALTRAGELLRISYSAADGANRVLEPSSYLVYVLGALPELCIERIEDDSVAISTRSQLARRLALSIRRWATDQSSTDDAATWLSIYEWARTGAEPRTRAAVAAAMRALQPIEPIRLSTQAAAALWPPPYLTSITQLEKMAACPFQHFAAYGLRLSERARHEVSQQHLGNLYHAVLEQFVNELMETGRQLGELTDQEIVDTCNRLCAQALNLYADALGLSEDEICKTRWRFGRELPFALRAHRELLGKTSIKPAMTEKWFGVNDGDLPAIELTLKNNIVHVRGKIDRVDFVQTSDRRLAVVFDYKRTTERRLKLDMVYHGLALQLLAYLLVLRDADARTANRSGGSARIVPGGAFFLPLLGQLAKVDHPDDASELCDEIISALRPRGIVDFDAIDELDPEAGDGKSKAFAVQKRKTDRKISNLDKSDAVPGPALPLIIDHVRSRMTELAESWIAGDVRVLPYRYGTEMPCTHCLYRAVCRFEHATHPTRRLEPMSRTEVISRFIPINDSGATDRKRDTYLE
ncbi:MAG: exodeoxyribonuclease V subunit gamma [Phycisphaerae bacterium]|nr:exodeoxyribonuclease V subunit gamma [Phycisphaerae bacterium]